MPPTYTLITSPTIHAPGALEYVRNLAAHTSGDLRAPSHTASRAIVTRETALAAGGVLLLDASIDFSPTVVSQIASLWTEMHAAVRPHIVVILRGAGIDELRAFILERFAMLFAGWKVDQHLAIDPRKEVIQGLHAPCTCV